jgi:hypothetical protein
LRGRAVDNQQLTIVQSTIAHQQLAIAVNQFFVTRGDGMTEYLLDVQDIHTYIGQYHILQGVKRAGAAGQASPRCWGATARARRPRSSRSWG